MRLSKGLCYYGTYRTEYNLNNPIYIRDVSIVALARKIAYSTLESMLKKYEIASNYKTQARYASIPKKHRQHQSPTPAKFRQPFSQNLGKLTKKRRSKHRLIQFSKSTRIKFTRASRTRTCLLTQWSPYQLTCPHLPCKYISRTRHRVRREFKPNLHASKHPCFQSLELSPPL